MPKLPNNLKVVRREKKLSQQALGNLIGKTKDAISKWERGERQLKVRDAHEISKVIGVPVGRIISSAEAGEQYGDIDSNLMNEAGKIIEIIVAKNKKIPYLHQLAATVSLYRHVIKYRLQGQNISPDEALGELILEKTLHEIGQ